MAQPKPLSENTVRRDIRRGAPHEKRKGKIFLNREEYFGWREAQNLTGYRGRPQPNDPEDLAAAKLAKLQEEVRIKRAQAQASIQKLYVKIRFADFRQTTAECSGHALDPHSYSALLETAYLRGQRAVRLLGLGTRLQEAAVLRQMRLFDA